ncbi:hypothetical protein PO909_029112 [Leuciscus waleckii]
MAAHTSSAPLLWRLHQRRARAALETLLKQTGSRLALLAELTHRCLCSSAADRTSMAEKPLVTAGNNFLLDYRGEQDVSCSRRDSRGCFVNPWTTWQFPSYSTIARLFLMEKNNSNVPSVKERASPLAFVGPKRYRDPPCTVEQIPRLDAVVISHTHYDHLDAGSVAALNVRFGSGLRWFVPLGLAEWMQKAGCENVTELDWWVGSRIPGHDDVTFFCTPAQHWCKRSPVDENKALWGSWTIVGPNCRFFFAGDTGYCSEFKEIGKRLGPFDLAAIPIGAYLPRGIMKSQHVDPEEAVLIHIDIQAKTSLAIHWGTFALAYEHYLEPPKRLREAMVNHGLNPDQFFTLHHGESRMINHKDLHSSS